MSQPGVNLAITKDGEAYNRLRRPDDFLTSLTKLSPKPTVAESSKRKLEDADVADSDTERASKRPKEKEIQAPAAYQKPLVPDPRRISRPIRECGMQSMFPGLDDDDSTDDSTQDALAYLRSVRSEASAIPRFMVAEPEMDEDEEDRTMYNDGRGDHRAWYNDGTWVAVDLDDEAGRSDDRWPDEAEELDPQEGYYKALIKRYNILRETLANADPKELAALVEADPAKYANMRLPNKRKPWLRTFDSDYPTPALVARMWDRNLFNALEWCAETLDRHTTISKKKSCWIWTLLALAGEKGTLDYYRIGRLRDLGQKAGHFGIRLRSGDAAIQPEEEEDDEVEEWIADGEGTDGEENEDDTHDVTIPPADGNESHKKEVDTPKQPIGPESSSVLNDSRARHGLQFDGANNGEADTNPNVAKQDESKERADMSISSDEGEISEEEQGPKPIAEESYLEAAKARLLAQLGDRLVKPSIPAPSPGYRPGYQKSGATRQGGRHRHDGKVCHSTNCRLNKQIQQSQPKDAHRESSATPPSKSFPSRAEAEKQRQKLREEELRKHHGSGVDYAEYTETAGPMQASINTRPVASTSDISDAKSVAEHAAKPSPPLASSEPNPASTQPNTEIEHARDSTSDSEMDSGAVDVDLNTRVTIDMILTVVAECYGQKDLLRYREVW